jgi:hypothetical protein
MISSDHLPCQFAQASTTSKKNTAGRTIAIRRAVRAISPAMFATFCSLKVPFARIPAAKRCCEWRKIDHSMCSWLTPLAARAGEIRHAPYSSGRDCIVLIADEDLQHALFLFTTHGKLYLAPIGDNPQNVLDMATGWQPPPLLSSDTNSPTGTGIWAIEFGTKFFFVPCNSPATTLTWFLAQQFPGSQVIGTDLSPIQPA